MVFAIAVQDVVAVSVKVPHLNQTVRTARQEASLRLVQHHAGDLRAAVCVGKLLQLLTRVHQPHGHRALLTYGHHLQHAGNKLNSNMVFAFKVTNLFHALSSLSRTATTLIFLVYR